MKTAVNNQIFSHLNAILFKTETTA